MQRTAYGLRYLLVLCVCALTKTRKRETNGAFERRRMIYNGVWMVDNTSHLSEHSLPPTHGNSARPFMYPEPGGAPRPFYTSITRRRTRRHIIRTLALFSGPPRCLLSVWRLSLGFFFFLFVTFTRSTNSYFTHLRSHLSVRAFELSIRVSAGRETVIPSFARTEQTVEHYSSFYLSVARQLYDLLRDCFGKARSRRRTGPHVAAAECRR